MGVSTGGDDNAAATNVLTMQEVSGQPGKYELVIKTLVGGSAQLPNTLWKVVVKQNSEGALSYQFINVATNMPLSLNSALAAGPASPTGTISAFPVPSGDALTVGGDVNTWKWQPAITSVDDYKSMGMYSAFGAKLDSAVTLVATTAIGNDVKVGAAKYALGNQPTGDDANQVWLAPFEAGSVVLTADDLNSMLWTQKYNAAASKVKLTFDKDVEGSTIGNLFTSQSYKAVPAVGLADYAVLPSVANTAFTSVKGTYTNVDNAQKALWAGKTKLSLGQALHTLLVADFTANKAAVATVAARIADVAVVVSGAKAGDKSTAGSAANILAEDGTIKSYIGANRLVADAIIAYAETVFDDAAAKDIKTPIAAVALDVSNASNAEAFAVLSLIHI